LRILSFFPFSPRTNIAYSGGERRFIEIYKEWKNMGHEIDVITTESGLKLFEYFEQSPSAYLYEPTNFKYLGLNNLIDLIRIMMKIPIKKYDLIYSPGEDYLCIVPSIFAKKKFNVPVVASFNMLDSSESKLTNYISKIFQTRFAKDDYFTYLRSIPRKLLRLIIVYLRNLFSKKIDLIFSVSSYVKEILQEMGIEKERIFSVSAGIPFDKILSINSDEKIYDCCFMGQIIPRKGIPDLIELWRIVTKKIPTAKIVLLGKGSEKYERIINEQIKIHGLQDTFLMKGFVTPENEKYRIMKQCRVFVFPSYLDTFGQAMCEAMACKLPVIAYFHPSYEEWYGDSMITVPRGDLKSMEDATLLLMKDEMLREKIGNKGMKVAKSYSWRNVARYPLDMIDKNLGVKI